MAKTDTSSKSKKSSHSNSKPKAKEVDDDAPVTNSEAAGVLAKFMKGLKEAVIPKGELVTTPAPAKRAPKSADKTAPTPSVLTNTSSEEAKSREVPAPTPGAPANPAAPAEGESDDEVILTDAEGRRYCRATDCDQIGIVDGYCRFHYLLYWKKIQNRKRILADGKLERYIEELTARYSDKFVELLRKDLRTEKDFMAALQELELDDSAAAAAGEEDEAKTYIEEISGVAAPESREDEGY